MRATFFWLLLVLVATGCGKSWMTARQDATQGIAATPQDPRTYYDGQEYSIKVDKERREGKYGRP